MYGYHFVSEILNTFEETFEVTELRTFKHEPFFIVGGGGEGGGGGAIRGIRDSISRRERSECLTDTCRD